VSAQPAAAQASARPFTKQDARHARKSYQHLAQVVNLIVNRIVQTLDEEDAKAFSPSVFQTIHCLHGMFNGREVSERKPMFRAHIFTAPHFGFRDRSGDQARREEAAARLVCRRLNDLEEAEAASGRRLFFIRRADGVTQKLTSYEGHPLLDAAEALYLKIRNAPDYFKNPAAAITEELLDEAVASLPVIEHAASVTATAERAPMDAGDLMMDAVLKGMWTKIVNSAENTLVKEFDAGSDPELVAREVAAKIEKIGKDVKQRLARERLRAFSSLGDEDTDAPVAGEAGGGDGKNNVGQDRGGYPDKVVTPPPSQAIDSQEVTETPFSEIENLTLRRALEYAAAEIAVVPLFGVSDGICDCSKGSECRTPGKHPLARCAPNGVHDATTEPQKIIKWFEANPNANLGIAMGGKHRLVGLDSDPRNGGDLSVSDLEEAHGATWLETHTVKTGSNGNHFLFRLPEGVEVHRGKIAPGIDVKAAGGLLVAPPSLHATGRRYEVVNNIDIAFAPDWLIEELTRSPEATPAKVVDFQERRNSSSAGARFFSGGERNNGLRDVACGRWTHGYAEDAQDLYAQLLHVRDTRCEFVPGDPPPSDADLWSLAQRTTRNFARGERKQEATA
jgi:hypothetical protein